MPLESEHGLGLYYHDCRFLNGYDLTFGNVVSWIAEYGDRNGDGYLEYVRRPVLPESVRVIEVRRLRVGAGEADLRFERAEDGITHCTVLQVKGDLDVAIEKKGTAESGEQSSSQFCR